MTSAAVLTAAGSGTRLGTPVPKALVPLDGVPLVLHAARGLADAGCLGAVVLTVPAGHVAAFAELFPDGRVPGTALPVTVVPGGPTRQASVAAGLAALPDAVDVVLVHDAARCLTPPALVRAVEAAVRGGHRAVVPALPVTDTVKRVGPPDAAGAEPVLATPDRGALRAVQTPQGFDRDLLARAHGAARARAGREGTAASDDAALVEALGETVWAVPGHELALKITTARDLALAEVLLAGADVDPAAGAAAAGGVGGQSQAGT
ncbi:2-C-methyl-D-erythritol 4-phosphate cytidylyltransferase [Georgenia sp. TF02-10]|uniref:2-C-methyl-D-erythritol 4-phosphate cytidylyltransferase n=1 Tax=Georgenia sp. TF02-10 TaxID=2917725 RepID=UPI001FA7F3AE|nr:2-C-methyl-D-erythritol 4-phosphate cytidylyltransferase [Georgenia sp. TF02-10]UNX55272.1 2-C-methyl-D-erythritol 4-phosphate cytidylyltransferase [Georgenia sp. TF02-10]